MNQYTDRFQLIAENDRLRKALEACRREHLVVDGDCWFSCPASGECCDGDAGTKCNCGADEFNARIDAALNIHKCGET